ncbi:MAG TPA: family 16 glycoside hydrolase [Planctomycetota bacterium]|nr:family 16 glycoside hydrolase [Planctomycetota bacterium]
MRAIHGLAAIAETCLLAAALASPSAAQAAESEHYVVDYLTPPDGAVLEVGGLAFLSDAELLVSTRRGQLWRVDDPLAADPEQASFQLVTEGLDEGLGLSTALGEVLVLQRGELSRISLSAPVELHTLNDDWGLSGNYHEFAFGLPADDQGRLYATLNVSFFSPKWWHGKSPVPYRGWALRFDPPRDSQGRIEAGRWAMHPVAPGLRSPCGAGRNSAGDIFVTDNQGDWMPAGPIFHLQEGRFYGHPAGLDWTPEWQRNGVRASDTEPPDVPRAPAAIWLPYKWSRSAGNLVEDETGGAFGPFAGQMFVAEVTNGMVLRCALEKVRGEYQGAVFLFRQRVGSACRVAFAPDGTLLVGMTNRGWGGLPPADGIARIRWTGELPMEMRTAHLLQDGFEIEFTKPLAAGLALGPGNVELAQYDYDWWWEYGSPERHTTKVPVTSVAVSPDRRKLTLRTAGLSPAMVARVVLSGIVAEDGTPLLHDEFAYTINQLPEGPLTTEHVAKRVAPPPPRESGDEGWLRLTYGDAFDAWTGAGWRLVEASLDPAEPRGFLVSEGDAALINTGATDEQGAPVAPTDTVGRYALGSGRYHVEFMLPEGGRSAVYVQGRYGIELADPEVGPARSPLPDTERTGALMAMGGDPARAPAFDAYKGAGQWHDLDLRFDAPLFDASGRKLANARLRQVTIDDVLLHDEVELPGVSPGAIGADEVALGPLVISGTRGPVAVRSLRMRPEEIRADAGAAEAGWVRLFNGESLEGWTLSPDAPTDVPQIDEAEEGTVTARLGGWRVEDGVLIGNGQASHLFSPRGDYTDLEFRAQVKIGDGGNSGMYFRVAYGPGWPAGYEAQVNSNFTDPQRTGSLYALAPVKVSLVPENTWFEQRITCRDEPAGTHITIAVNGVVVTDFVDPERRHRSGHVALQQHHDGSVVSYKDIEVRELR